MIDNCYDYASAARKSGKPIVGILCEYTPRELIMAAGAVPVCLCGGSVETIYSAEEDLPANLCPLIKSTYGFHVEGSNPFLEMADLIVAETTCDGKKKMYELMAETRPMYVLELPHKAADTDSFEHWVLELKKFKHELEVRFSTTITDDGLREAMKQMNRERSLRRQLAALMKAKHPPLTGRELLDFKSSISCIQTDLDQYQAAIEHYTAKETDLSAPSRVRVLLTGVPVVHGAEKVVDIIEDRGGLIVCMENCTGIKPIIEDVEEQTDDPIRSIAEKYFHLHCSVMTPNERRLEAIESLAKDYNADCVIDLIWQACLTYDIESRRVKRLVEQKLGIPYLRIETDYSPSDSSRIAVRVEALFETILGSGKRSAQ
ncbi:MAG TPA: double-cubane-cluster-containing anaerobic reductase [Armatimonadota bacterium]|jgi:benzoyl-CoA reductase/2-hydroxyglutaryl-CoA dehydratase subunit BcrC/BadD/HgdB